jgi:2-oxoisovalerate dehydrogenase E2 component (dihydrolipoyl transacylase)
LYYREDETCQVGDVFLEMETNAPETHHQPKKVEENEKKAHVEHSQEHGIHHEEFLASSTVKMHARGHKINLKEVKGTGRKGRILKEDIIHFV